MSRLPGYWLWNSVFTDLVLYLCYRSNHRHIHLSLFKPRFSCYAHIFVNIQTTLSRLRAFICKHSKHSIPSMHIGLLLLKPQLPTTHLIWHYSNQSVPATHKHLSLFKRVCRPIKNEQFRINFGSFPHKIPRRLDCCNLKDLISAICQNRH